MLSGEARSSDGNGVLPIQAAVHRVHVFTPAASATTVVAPVAPQSGFVAGPFLILPCVLLTAFLIASSIVLALIPIYVPGKSATLKCPEYYVTLFYNGSLGNDGQLDSAARTQFAQAIAQANNLPTNRVIIDTADVIRTSDGNERIYISFHLAPIICSLNHLNTRIFTATVSFTFRGQTVTATFTFAISTNPFSIPPSQPNPTETTSTTTTTGSTPPSTTSTTPSTTPTTPSTTPTAPSTPSTSTTPSTAPSTSTTTSTTTPSTPSTSTPITPITPSTPSTSTSTTPTPITPSTSTATGSTSPLPPTTPSTATTTTITAATVTVATPSTITPMTTTATMLLTTGGMVG